MNPQRKGQYLWNTISSRFLAHSMQENCEKVENILWNMSNKEFDDIMKGWETNE